MKKRYPRMETAEGHMPNLDQVVALKPAWDRLLEAMSKGKISLRKEYFLSDFIKQLNRLRLFDGINIPLAERLFCKQMYRMGFAEVNYAVGVAMDQVSSIRIVRTDGKWVAENQKNHNVIPKFEDADSGFLDQGIRQAFFREVPKDILDGTRRCGKSVRIHKLQY